MSPLLDTLLVFVLAINLFALGTSRITALIRAVTLQGILIGFMPLLGHGHAGFGTWLAVALAVALKGGLIPAMLHRAMRDVGFSDRRALLFPQPVYPGGSITCTLARKGAMLGAFRVEDAANKLFHTRYYNVGIHQGALTPPEFVREALSSVE